MTGYDDIEEGIRRREFFLEYLPIVDIETGHCVGAEALIRWRRSSGIAYPLEFIDRVENSPLSGSLAYYVLEEIAGQLLDWLKESDAFISFNVSPELLGRGGLDYVSRKTGLADIKHKIVVEIVERGVPDRLGIEALSRATALGVRIALDDVGIAGANPVVLARCHVDMIKFDRRLISQVRNGEPLPSGLEAISALLKTGTITAVAEGVESVEQVEVLRAAGIRLVQGYYFSPPISASEFKDFFNQRYVSFP